MALLKLMSVILLLFLVDRATSHGCSWTHFRLGKLNEDSTKFLKTMGGDFPQGCLDEKGRLMFPEDAFKSLQTEDLAVVALEVLKNVDKIFENDLTSVPWNPGNLKVFRNLVSRQVENLLKCTGDESTLSGDQSTSTSSRATLKSYFQKLDTVLKEKEFSACAWEIVRYEVHYTLEKFKGFLNEGAQQ